MDGYLSCRAFRNPAYVETFTEGKKQSHLIKRQRKGADFVRAVQEIIDMDSSRLQNFMKLYNDVRTAFDISTNAIPDGSLRRDKRFKKSAEAFESDDFDSSMLMSNVTIDYNGSEIATVDLDGGSLHEGTVDSICKPEHSENNLECLEGDAELSEALDLQIKAVVIKKKRKPFIKWMNNDLAEPPVRMDKEENLNLGINIAKKNLLNRCENPNDGYSKDDGDEHQPLLKRARVRMGKLEATGDFNCSLTTEEKLVDEVTFKLKGSTPDGPEPLKVERNQLGWLAGSEAALPPSKCLHRALEAMSANPAEDQTCQRSDMSLDPITVTEKACKILPQEGSNVFQCTAQHRFHEKSESLKSQTDDNSLVHDVCEVPEAFQTDRRQMATRLFRDDNSDKDVVGVQLSPSPVDEVYSPARVSPSNALNIRVSTSESANIIQSNGYCSPNVQSRSNKSLSVSIADSEESIAHATRIAFGCAKFGVSAKIVEIITRNSESESSHKGGLVLSRGFYYSMLPEFENHSRALPRLLSAAAPPGPIAHENRRQCLKVKILSEPVVRYHIKELDSFSVSSSGGPFCRHTARTERPFDHPVRDMEGMLVDEYGSFQLPGFCMPRILKDDDEGSDYDGSSFEAVTPENDSRIEQEENPIIEKHRHILEDVDGEIEMEDVAPSEIEMSLATAAAGVNAAQASGQQEDQHFSFPFAPHLPHDVHPSSPPPPLPPPPPPNPPCPMSDHYASINSAIHTSIHNRLDDLRSTDPSSVPYHGHESRDLPVPMQVSDFNTSFNSYSVHQMNNNQQTNGPNIHHNDYLNDPSSSALESVLICHNRMQPALHDPRDNWRFPSPPLCGRYAADNPEAYGFGSYGGRQCEPTRYPNQGWGFHPPPMNHRNSFTVLLSDHIQKV
ncbi:Tudor/PWWP/MBT domain-containing protein, putative isoform 2 [Hibiscus syriacus]|uniref:Tudor/PWWP/MBT domain-containing protein, putative isoform 2 n=1 Tax=Hibiscus syriacus TaxID=106335 RepID=A0A6A3B2Y2_HIBSY|nr:Tudor/PWWP/MBT domain-containing protein, putative isoform 2 [Hibiscus syriacus]